MLELLEALLLVLLRGVVEAKGIPAVSTLADAKVAGLVARALLTDDADALDLKVGHEEEDLKKTFTGDLGEGLEGVGVRENIVANCLVSGEGTEEAGRNEAKNGDLGNTAVDKLGFAVPVQVTDLSVTALNTVEPGANRDSGETKGIETSITDH